jgi:gliding motility-associated lipoprotein GldH
MFFGRVTIVFLLHMISCNHQKKAEKEILSSGWSYKDPLIFEYKNTDTSLWKNLKLNLAIQPQVYPYRNLYLLITIQTPSGKEVKDIKEFLLADEFGNWFVEPDWRGICKFISPLLVKTKFLENGIYTFTLAQYMRNDTLKGVKSIAITLEDVQN